MERAWEVVAQWRQEAVENSAEADKALVKAPASIDDLKGLAQSWQEGQGEDSAIQIIADKGLPFDDVMKAHTTLSKAGVKRIAFGVVSSSSN